MEHRLDFESIKLKSKKRILSHTSLTSTSVILPSASLSTLHKFGQQKFERNVEERAANQWIQACVFKSLVK